MNNGVQHYAIRQKKTDGIGIKVEIFDLIILSSDTEFVN